MGSNLYKLAVCASVSLAVAGCGTRYFTPREANPVLEDYVGSGATYTELGTLSTDVAHRVTTVRMKGGQPANDVAWQRGEFCAEPPPDAMLNLATAVGGGISAAIEAEAATGGAAGGKGSGELEVYRILVTVMAPLLRRSQGLQWNRDNMSFLCHAYLNRMITRQEYINLTREIMSRSQAIITAEIDKLPALKYEFTGQTPGAPAPIQPPNVVSPPSN